MLRRGFSLANTIILSTLITLIGVAGIMLVNINSASSRAENKYLLAEKAANAGLLEAMKRIQASGFCDVNQTFTGRVGGATYEVNIRRSSRICFIRSEGKVGRAKVIKTGILQAYYGVGLYTVRGNVNARLYSGVRLSGCDNSARPPCFVPSFIASGSVYSAIRPRACRYDRGGSGVYGGYTGREAIITYVRYTDLIPLFFNVNCFNIYDSPGCDVGLLQIFQREYGRNPSNDRQDMFFDNEWGIPRINLTGLPPAGACTTNNSNVNVGDFSGCTDLAINSSSDVYISGSITNYINIYVLNSPSSRVYIDSGISTRGFTLYTTREVIIRRDLRNARIITPNIISIVGNRGIRDSILIAAPTNVSNTNNPNSGAELHTDNNRTVTFDHSQIFARHIHFGNNARIYVLDSLMYVYAYACPSCDRTSDTSSLDACSSNERWCGWYGRYIRLSIGRDASGRERPSIIISNNSTVYTVYPYGRVYIWGAFIGEDITYLLWTVSWWRGIDQNLRGFLVRNFPQTSTLRINIGAGFTLEFSKSLLDRLSNNFWYFRKIQCIRDDINPRTQLIHTRLTAY